ncbi:MAG TPA: bifunctional shikimate kinase/3-dehydroquinate synthase [Solirubrobacteraceae bacterium]
MEQIVQQAARQDDGTRPARALVFIGFMGAGKSTAARLLAEQLDLEAVDSDRLLCERFGHSVAEEFAQHGEASFRAAEEELVCELLERAGPGSVIALGGGSVTSKRVRAALEPHVTVLLDVEVQDAWARAHKHPETHLERPLASDKDAFTALYTERRRLYEGLADAILPPTPRQSIAAANPALLNLAGAPSHTKLLWASAASGSYPVFFGEGLARSGFWPVRMARRFLISDETVAGLYMQDLGELHGSVTIQPGEQHKTLSSAETVFSALVRAGITRADQLVALGGGVVGDLAGFCAATYQRGVPVIHIPSTLVAQVDSAYGGKTGVDLPEAKNYVGAYHQPTGVIVDFSLLKTLPAPELAAGYSEVLKTALIAGGDLWERICAEDPLDERMIHACARTKLAIVAEDERDTGRRQVLNLGHTVGHALEALTGYRRLRHGEAVALGLLAALRLSGLSDLRQQVSDLLSAHGLPVTIAAVDPHAVIAAVAHDKKRTGERVPFVLVERPGDVRGGYQVGDRELLHAISELIT